MTKRLAVTKQLAALLMLSPFTIAVVACGGTKSSATPSSATTTSAASDLPAANTADATAIAAIRAIFANVGPNDPGCTFAVARDGQVVFAEAYGAKRLEPTEPMTISTVVDIGSTSKQFTATAILLLVQQGEVELDAPLTTYLPGVAPWASLVTVREMMHHQSGIPDYIELLDAEGFEMTGTSTDVDALAALAETTLDSEPGTTFEYSNSNYFLLGQIVLSVTGVDLGQFLTTEVFTPLNLAMTMDPTANIASKAISYEGVGTDRTVADSAWEQLGDGGIQTTPSELVKWASQYWAPTIGGPTINTQRFELAADDTEDGGQYGAGIVETYVDGVGRVLSHGGGWAGFETFFTLAPDRKLAVAATCTSAETVEALGLSSDVDLLAPWL